MLADLRAAVHVLQGDYFDKAAGSWPTSIDWTAAVGQTMVSAVARTHAKKRSPMRDNEINELFLDIIASYYSQDALRLRHEVLFSQNCV